MGMNTVPHLLSTITGKLEKQTSVNGAANFVSGSGAVIALATGITTVSTQTAVAIPAGPKSIEGYLTGTGAITATINVYGVHTNRNTNGKLIGTLSLSGTTIVADALVSDVPYPYLYSDVTAITGTSATLNVTVGI